MEEKESSNELLDIAYRDEGPKEGRTILLLHGRPDSASMGDKGMPRTARCRLPCYHPTLRGYGNTRFRDASTLGTGTQEGFSQRLIGREHSVPIGQFQPFHEWQQATLHANSIFELSERRRYLVGGSILVLIFPAGLFISGMA